MKYIFLRFPNFKKKAVTLSYDDNCIFDNRLVDIMCRYGLKGTFNLNSGFLCEERSGRKLTIKEAKHLYLSNGMEVAVHGQQHLSLPEVNSIAKVKDIYEDKKALENIFNCIIDGMAYANGTFDDESINVLKLCGIKYARTTISSNSFDLPNDWLRLSPTCHHNDPNLMSLSQKFIDITPKSYFWDKDNAPLLFYLWGHSYQFNDENNWDVIENWAKFIGNRDDIYYATNGEIYRYVQAFKSLEQSVEGNLIFNPTAIDVYLQLFDNTEVVVKSGQMIKINNK